MRVQLINCVVVSRNFLHGSVLLFRGWAPGAVMILGEQGELPRGSWVQLSSVAQSCPTLCYPMNCSTPGLPVHHQLPELGWSATDGEGKRTTVDVDRDYLNIYQGSFIFTFCFHSENYELYCIIVKYTHNLIRPDPLMYLITLFPPAQLVGWKLTL